MIDFVVVDTTRAHNFHLNDFFYLRIFVMRSKYFAENSFMSSSVVSPVAAGVDAFSSCA